MNTLETQTQSRCVCTQQQPCAILGELWAVNAKLNAEAEAEYDVDKLIAIVRREAAPHVDENGRVRAAAYGSVRQNEHR